MATEIAMIWKEVQKGAEELGRYYAVEFKKKFGAPPFESPEETELECLRWLYRQHGLETSQQLISTFLGMEDEWFTKMGHSLPQLKKNVVRVIEANGAKSHRRRTDGKRSLGILACDACWEPFSAVFDVNTRWESVMIRCPSCISTNRSFKYPGEVEFKIRFPNTKYPFHINAPAPNPDLKYEIYKEEERIAIQEEQCTPSPSLSPDSPRF